MSSLQVSCHGAGGQRASNDQSLISSLPVPVVPPPRPPSTLSSHGTPGPPLPDRNKQKQPSSGPVMSELESTKQWQLSPRALIHPPSVSTNSAVLSSSSVQSTSSTFPGYKAMYEYKAVQRDELSLKKGDLYHVTERCHDGWFRGRNIKTGKTGVFPGNYVKQYDENKHDNIKKSKRKENVNVQPDLIDLSEEVNRVSDVAAGDNDPEARADRLQKLKEIRETLRQQMHHSAASGKVKSEKYRLVSTMCSHV